MDKEGNPKKISATSVYFSSKPYYVNETTARIDYDRLEADAAEFKPKLIVAGYSGHTRDLCVGLVFVVCVSVCVCVWFFVLC